jgi:hypothetical protein
MRFKYKNYSTLDGTKVTLSILPNERSIVKEVFIDFNIYNLKVKQLVYGKYTQEQTAKVLDSFFYEVKKKIEKEMSNILVVLNHPRIMAPNSPDKSDFTINITHYYPQGLQFNDSSSFFYKVGEDNVVIAMRVSNALKMAVNGNLD